MIFAKIHHTWLGPYEVFGQNAVLPSPFLNFRTGPHPRRHRLGLLSMLTPANKSTALSSSNEAIKEKIVDYWTERTSSFSDLRCKEFFSEKKDLWLVEIAKHLPSEKPLNILDMGTGTGFFCFLLGQLGHNTTGIDLTESMIDKARELSKQLQIQADFHVMDAESPDFADGRFDVLISRNLTWTLPNLEKAYNNWHRLLKPGGLLINFDADYQHQQPDSQLPTNHSHATMSKELVAKHEHIMRELSITQVPQRPAWDKEILEKAGFRNIEIDPSPWERIYAIKDELYNPVPIFCITAQA